MTDKPQTNGNGSRFIQQWVPLGAGAVAVIASISGYFISQGETAQTISNLQLTVQEQGRKLGRNDVRIGSLEGEVSSRRAFDCQQFVLIEVQIQAMETLLNKTQVENEREMSLLWNKTYGQAYPDVFYPVTVAHDPPKC
ncbi:MAG: hypothetical protein KGL39_04645 [Patescibacteria group bacterium]|nr:hypothetical protein [Patescibacteria group bacterium]